MSLRVVLSSLCAFFEALKIWFYDMKSTLNEEESAGTQESSIWMILPADLEKKKYHTQIYANS